MLCYTHLKGVLQVAGKTDYKRKWNEENLERLYITVKVGKKDKIIERAKTTGFKSYNEYINNLIDKDMEKGGA